MPARKLASISYHWLTNNSNNQSPINKVFPLQNKSKLLTIRELIKTKKTGLNDRINLMDDLNDDPQKVAEDIIKQATKGLGFRQTATDRIIHILNCYQQLQQEIAESKEKKETDFDISYEGALAWRIKENQKLGPYCARCYNKDKELLLMVELQNGLWECPKCNRRFNVSSYHMHDDDGDDSGGYTWSESRRK